MSHRPLLLALCFLTLFPGVQAQTNVPAAPPAPRRTPPEEGRRAILPAGTRILNDLEYIPGGGERNRLDLYLPGNATSPLPVIVWVHGGAWRAGSKANCPARRFVAKGYAVASLNYRLSQQAVFPAQLEDCKAAVRWLRAHAADYQLDADRFAAWGSSAGGHLVALLGTTGDTHEFDKGDHLDQPSRVQAVVDWFGPTDFMQMNRQRPANARMDHNAADSPEALLIGGAVQENPGKAARANPITYVSEGDPPFLIMHGNRDPLVPYQQSELLRDALQGAGVPVKLILVEGAGHGLGGPDVNQSVEAFLDTHLQPGR
jgi:acetyl esterase/lipase